MRVKRFSCNNFRLFDSMTFTLDADRVFIVGDNYRGKTTIAEGITIALYGATLSGSDRTDHLIRQGAKGYEVTVQIEIDGKDYEITRTKGGKSAGVWLDGQKVAQSEVDKLLPSKDRWLSVWNPGYFTSLPDKEGREILMGLVKLPPREDVLAKLSEPEQELLRFEQLRDPDGRATELRTELKDAAAELQRTMGQIDVLRERVNREIPENKSWDDTELTTVRGQLQATVSDASTQRATLEGESQRWRHEYERLKAQLKQPPTAPYQTGDPCPVCKCDMDEDALANVLENHHRQVHQVEEANQQVMKAIQDHIQRGNDLKARLDALGQSDVDSSQVAELQSRIDDLEKQKADVIAHNAHVGRLRFDLADDKDRLAKTEERAKILEGEKARTDELLAAIANYRAKLAELQVAQLAKHLDRVSIQLFDVVKSTGEIKPAFHVLYDGKPYKSLSRSEGIRANLELCTLFNQVLGFDIPVYIDNAESITHFVQPFATQVFTATVIPGADLAVTVASEAKEEGRVAS